MPKRWLIRLPALYAAFLCLVGIEMAFGLTGGGEANLGAWMFIFSLVPAAGVAQMFGIHIYIGESASVTASLVLMQLLMLAIAGAAIDAFLRRKRQRGAVAPDKSQGRADEK
jgi:hypothetical protein